MSEETTRGKLILTEIVIYEKTLGRPPNLRPVNWKVRFSISSM